MSIESYMLVYVAASLMIVSAAISVDNKRVMTEIMYDLVLIGAVFLLAWATLQIS